MKKYNILILHISFTYKIIRIHTYTHAHNKGETTSDLK